MTCRSKVWSHWVGHALEMPRGDAAGHLLEATSRPALRPSLVTLHFLGVTVHDVRAADAGDAYIKAHVQSPRTS
jgi:hypothetical protein